MSTTQMNIRIERDVKAAGDKALAEVGLTPTEVVREVWSFAARNGHDRQKVRDMMGYLKEEAADTREERDRQRLAAFEEWLERGPQHVRESCASLGVDLASEPAVPADVLLEEAYDEEIERLWGAR